MAFLLHMFSAKVHTQPTERQNLDVTIMRFKIGTNKIPSNLRQLIRSACVKQRIWHWQGLAMVLVVEFPFSNIELRLFKQQLSYKVSYEVRLIFILHVYNVLVLVLVLYRPFFFSVVRRHCLTNMYV